MPSDGLIIQYRDENNNWSNKLTILKTGEVGIGKPDPGAMFEIANTGSGLDIKAPNYSVINGYVKAGDNVALRCKMLTCELVGDEPYET